MVRSSSPWFPRSSILLLFLIAILVSPACAPVPVPADQADLDKSVTPGGREINPPGNESGPSVSGLGTVVHLDFEGGFYGILADDGTKLDPAGLPESCRVDGLRVAFKGVITGGYTTHMWGKRIRITSISPM